MTKIKTIEEWSNDPIVFEDQLKTYGKAIDKQLADMVNNMGGNPSFFEDCVQSALLLAMQEG